MQLAENSNNNIEDINIMHVLLFVIVVLLLFVCFYSYSTKIIALQFPLKWYQSACMAITYQV